MQVAMRNFTFFRPHAGLANIVERIWHAEIPDGDAARETTITVLPAASQILGFHNGAPTLSRDWFGTRHRQRLAGVTSRALTLQPSGPMRSVMVRLRPEAAFCLIGIKMGETTDIAIPLCDVFKPRDLTLLDEMMSEASGPAARVASVELFLMQQIRRAAPDPLIRHATALLRQDPGLSIRRLASLLDISERQLCRRFHGVIGAGPKQFARIIRIEKAVAAARKGGVAWTDVAHSCGFNDQAHMIHDFNAMIGRPPQAFFRTVARDEGRRLNVSLAASGFRNTFVTYAHTTGAGCAIHT
jgi:AraC-like DNA-binding protein